MRDQRTRDRLVGAALAVLVMVLVLVLAVVGLLWWASEPAPDDTAPPPGTGQGAVAGTGTADQSAVEVPADLAADETWLGDVALEAGAVVTPDSRLRDVDAVARQLRAGPDGVVAGGLDVQATVPFEVVARELGEDTTVRAAEGSRAAVVRTVDLLGRRLRVVATGTVDVADGRLVVHPESVDVGGPAVLSRTIADVVRELVTIEHTVDGLPDGLVLTDVQVQQDGFRADLQGEDVVLSP